MESRLPELKTELNRALLEFGWGAEGFYRSEEVTLSLAFHAFHALAYLTASVIHIANRSVPLHYDYV